MTLANQDLPGQFIHSIRRTSERRFFLRPCPRSRLALRYAYAVAIEETELRSVAEMTMGNHRHGGLGDEQGNRSDFHERYHGMVGAAFNRALNRQGNHFWDNRGPTAIVCLDGEGPVYEKKDEKHDEELETYLDGLRVSTQDRVLLYIWLNPVKANLVDRVSDWPGFWIGPDDWGTEITAYRTRWFGSGYPPKATFTPMPPERWGDDISGAKKYYRRLIRKCEAFYRKRRKKQGKGVLGPKGVMRVDPFDRPKTPDRPRWRRPRFCGPSELRVKAYAAYGVFEKNHRVARRKFRNGDRDVVFPAGTVQMRRLAGVRCRGRPLPEEDPMP